MTTKVVERSTDNSLRQTSANKESALQHCWRKTKIDFSYHFIYYQKHTNYKDELKKIKAIGNAMALNSNVAEHFIALIC